MSKIIQDSKAGYFFLGAMSFLFILMIRSFIYNNDEYESQRREIRRQELQRQADERAMSIVYSKDTRTGICYAFSGPHFTNVPCETASIKPFASTDM